MADLLVIAPHPDDAEIHCGGTIAHHVALGAEVVVIDCTAGEMGSRGDAQTRAAEAQAAAEVLGLSERECLHIPDGALTPHDPEQRRLIVDAIRRHKASSVIAMGPSARHPDHLALHELMRYAAKTAALHKYPTPSGAPAVPGVRCWFHEGECPASPDFLVPLSQKFWDIKLLAISCYGSQLHQKNATNLPPTTIARPEFSQWISARGRVWGEQCGAPYAEAFTSLELPRVGDLRTL